MAATCLLFFLLANTSPCNNADVAFTNNLYTIALSGTGSWSPPVEYYTGFWAWSDGGFDRIDYHSATTIPAITTPVDPGGRSLAFSTISNRKGDDNDKKKISGGYNMSTSLPAALSYLSFPASQHLNSGNAFTMISTDHGVNTGLRSNELMLVITINNDSNKLAIDSPSATAASKYKLHLYRNNGIIYGVYPAETANGNYPCGNDKYFAYADVTSMAHPVQLLTEIKAWVIESNFSGHQKNVYCLLAVPSGEFTSGGFTALITNGANNVVPGSISTYNVTYSNSLDPNFIEVNKAVSTECGKGTQPEELEYTIQFQNTDRANENAIGINLDLDAALDKTTLVVTEAGIGNSVIMNPPATNAMSTTNPVFSFSYATQNPGSVFTATSSQLPTVTADAAFFFIGTDILKGTDDATDAKQSVGYIKFRIKTTSSYSVIHNYAGIFFGNTNREVVTNLATTSCDSTGSDCSGQLAACENQLNHCRKNHDSFSFEYMLPWIIAVVEFLLLMFLLVSRRKKER